MPDSLDERTRYATSKIFMLGKTGPGVEADAPNALLMPRELFDRQMTIKG